DEEEHARHGPGHRPPPDVKDRSPCPPGRSCLRAGHRVCNVNPDAERGVEAKRGGMMLRSAWWLGAALAFGCANSTESARPPPDASTPLAAAQAPAAPEERALPDAGLTLQPMAAPPGTIPTERLELPNPSPAGAAGFRAVQNDTPPPKKP